MNINNYNIFFNKRNNKIEIGNFAVILKSDNWQM
jgi:hypothetical protein